MSPYIEVEGNPREGEPKMGIPLPSSIREKGLVTGQEVVLVDSKYADSDSGESVTFVILPDGKMAKVLVKTKGCCFRPGMVEDKEKGAIWFGAVPHPCEAVRTLKHQWVGKVQNQRRQKTVVVKEQTIIANSLRRVEWREK